VIGSMTALVVGFVFGLGVASVIDGVFTDPQQPSPGMAAFGVFALSVLVGLIVWPVVASTIYWLAFRRTALSRGPGYLLAASPPFLGACAGFLLGVVRSART